MMEGGSGGGSLPVWLRKREAREEGNREPHSGGAGPACSAAPREAGLDCHSFKASRGAGHPGLAQRKGGCASETPEETI